MTVDVERAMGAVLPVLVSVAAVMSGVYWLVKRRNKINQEKDSDEEKKVEVTK